jgi:hypothetical protein
MQVSVFPEASAFLRPDFVQFVPGLIAALTGNRGRDIETNTTDMNATDRVFIQSE